MTMALRPRRGGFLRPFGCGWFIREFLLGNGPHGSPMIDINVGAPQVDILYHYKEALRQTSAMTIATGMATRTTRGEKRAIDSGNIGSLNQHYLARITYKPNGYGYYNFVVKYSNLRRRGWLELYGKTGPSAFQGNYPPRGYCRLDADGSVAPDYTWSNPLSAHCV